jgi:tetratricopeptide (TPR) repeat protein
MSRDLELEKRIDAYIKGKLTEQEAQNLWEKLLLRPDYIELLETELGVKAILENRTDTAQPSASNAEETGVIYSLKQSRKWIAAAAAAIVVLVVAISFLQFESQQTIGELAIQNIDISTHLSSTPVLRSQKSEIAPSDSLLNSGFEAAISGNMTKAMQIYDNIIEQYPDKPAAVESHLNKGIIQYNAREFTDAIASFKLVLQQVRNKPVTKEKAYWYMGNAFINLNEMSKARDAVRNAAQMEGIYYQSASRLLQKLDEELEDSTSEKVSNNN